MSNVVVATTNTTRTEINQRTGGAVQGITGDLAYVIGDHNQTSSIKSSVASGAVSLNSSGTLNAGDIRNYNAPISLGDSAVAASAAGASITPALPGAGSGEDGVNWKMIFLALCAGIVGIVFFGGR